MSPELNEFGLPRATSSDYTTETNPAHRINPMTDITNQVPPVTNLNFGDAIAALKSGKHVARKGWNGKGMFLFLLPAATVPIAHIHTEPFRSLAEANGGTIECLGSIRMFTADKKVLTGWLASQADMLSEDWEIVGIPSK